MDLADSPDEAQYRVRARAWLEREVRSFGPWSNHDDSPAGIARRRAWQRRLYEGGWTGITWPREAGGQGATPVHEAIFEEEQARAGRVDTLFRPAIHDAGRLLLAAGSPGQRAHLRRILAGEEIWCHLLSEPEAGSDLANLATRAVPDGDQFVVNGQKIWTSYAHVADFGLLLARTDPHVPKHKGLTYFILDMDAPGVSIRPIRQMTGGSHFNEVFFTDVVIPAGAVVGEINGGWGIARTSMSNERAYIGSQATSNPKFPDLLDLARARHRTGDPATRQRLAACYTRDQVLRFLRLRAHTALSQGQQPGPETSLLKLALGRHAVESAGDAMALLGPLGTVVEAVDADNPGWVHAFLDSPRGTIGGGTEQMQLNTIAERLLNLPREPGGEGHIPWSEARRSRRAPPTLTPAR